MTTTLQNVTGEGEVGVLSGNPCKDMSINNLLGLLGWEDQKNNGIVTTEQLEAYGLIRSLCA